MNEYILFIDTETSDRPRNWNSPTSEVNKWPYILQISWTICKKSGEQVLTRNFYIYSNEITIHIDSYQIHGITLEYLLEKGISRKEAFQYLANDLLEYDPVIVGHFVKFDLKMLEVGFNRADISMNFEPYTKFCTMQYSYKLLMGDRTHLLKLNELYYRLFNVELKNQHNALVDAIATKDCFFELIKREMVTDKIIEKQQKTFKPKRHLRSVLLQLLSVY